ncbi:hypothetical protein, partial [Nocardia farcinica]|uniref:hypothetical protein n=1 Tax=Nocardia farcinica TaxID=37329 RepID=UPI003CC7E831
ARPASAGGGGGGGGLPSRVLAPGGARPAAPPRGRATPVGAARARRTVAIVAAEGAPARCPAENRGLLAVEETFVLGRWSPLGGERLSAQRETLSC